MGKLANSYRGKLEVSARAIIEDRGRILVCRMKKEGFYFFPGGHIEFGERPGRALKRELREELGVTLRKFAFMGVVDNIFTHGGEVHHEFILVFKAIVAHLKVNSREHHIEFTWLSKKKFANTAVYPLGLRGRTITWLRNKKIFWLSQ